MKRSFTIRTGRKGRVALALGAAAIAGLAVVGGATAANAAPAPAPKPAAAQVTGEAPAIFVDCAPDLTAVQQGNGVSLQSVKPPTGTDAEEPVVVAVNCEPSLPDGRHSNPVKPSIGSEELSLVEVPGAVPDLDNVQAETPTAVDAVPEPIGEGKTTNQR